jgi:hypothetical protein
MTDPLLDALTELLEALSPDPPALVVGGGYGLVLKAKFLRDAGLRTRHVAPASRSTADIDCFLTAAIIVDGTATKRIREALDALGYRPIVQHFQFAREIDYFGQPRTIRFDFLAADVADRGHVHVSGARIRPHGFDRFHGRLTPEAFAVADTPIAIDLGAGLTYVPHPFAYLILKLFALRDRLGDPSSNEGKYHALDLYTIWALITEQEWDEVITLRGRYDSHAIMGEVRAIVASLFGDISAPGVEALIAEARRSGVILTRGDIVAFREDLHTLLAER